MDLNLPLASCSQYEHPREQEKFSRLSDDDSTNNSSEEDISDSDYDYSSELEDLWERRNSHEFSWERRPIFSYLSKADQVVPMVIDTDEDQWSRVQDIFINGTVFQYNGEGKSITHNGFAQSNVALNPAQNYFEIKILDPGENCYIAIGLARKDYPMQKHPGWNRGSVAFHADDGKLFVGGGVGTPFGPVSSRNDVLGCGIVFPSLFWDKDSCSTSTWPWEKNPLDIAPPKARIRRRRKYYHHQNPEFQEHSSDSEDEIWWKNRNQVYFEDKVFVFFRRNGVLLGIKEVRIPIGGFFPTIGMMSKHESVQVNLNPLTG